MSNLDLKHADPMLLARLAAYGGASPAAAPFGPAAPLPGVPGALPGIVQPGATHPGAPVIIPGRGPVAMPVAMPGPPAAAGTTATAR